VIRRGRTPPSRELRLGEGFVDQESAGRERRREVREQIALQVARHDDQLESAAGQRRSRQVGTPGTQRVAASFGRSYGRGNERPLDIDAERAASELRQQQRVAAASHREVERAARRRNRVQVRSHPAFDERRRWIGWRRVGHT
jgi:hypothetical protein